MQKSRSTRQASEAMPPVVGKSSVCGRLAEMFKSAVNLINKPVSKSLTGSANADQGLRGLVYRITIWSCLIAIASAFVQRRAILSIGLVGIPLAMADVKLNRLLLTVVFFLVTCHSNHLSRFLCLVAIILNCTRWPLASSNTGGNSGQQSRWNRLPSSVYPFYVIGVFCFVDRVLFLFVVIFLLSVMFSNSTLSIVISAAALLATYSRVSPYFCLFSNVFIALSACYFN